MRKIVGVAIGCLLVSACAGNRERLVASFDHSEWHRSSMLVLDVPSGGFQARFRDGTLANGRFSRDEMREIRARLEAARAAGFAAPPENPGPLIVSNGGDPTLELRGRGVYLTAPSHEWEWTQAAHDLHDYINQALDARGDEWRMPVTRTRSGKLDWNL